MSRASPQPQALGSIPIDRPTSDWRGVFWALLIFMPLMFLGLVGIFVPDRATAGPPLVLALAEAVPSNVDVETEAQRLSPGVIEEEFSAFRPGACRSAAEAIWVVRESNAWVWTVLCRTGAEDSARKLSDFEIRLGSVDPVEEPEGFPSGSWVGSFVDETVSEVHAGWNVADVMVFVFLLQQGSNTDLTLLQQLAGRVSSELDLDLSAAGFAAPLLNEPAGAIGAAVALALTLYVLLLAAGALAREIRSRGSRRFDRWASPSSDVSPRARQIRWLGRVVWLGQGFVFIALPVSFVIWLMWGEELDVVSFPGQVLIAPGVVLLASALMLVVWRRVDGGRRRSWTMRHRPLRVAVLAALGVVATGLGLLLLGMLAASFAFDSELRPLMTEEMQAQYSAAEAAAMVMYTPAIAALLVTANWLLGRSGRMASRTFGDIALASEHPKLLLRSFDDDALRTRLTPSPRHGVLDAWSIRATDYFEEQLAWELVDDGPVLAVAEPGSRRRGLGVVHVELGDESWREWVTDRMIRSPVICCVLGRSRGFRWEVRKILELGLFDRTIFVVPPRPEGEIAERWRLMVENVPSLNLGRTPPGAIATALAFVVREDGEVWTVGANRRDEAGYRAALEQCRRWTKSKEPVHTD